MLNSINGYELNGPMYDMGGFTSRAVAVRGNREYLLKEFRNPPYPTGESISSELSTDLINVCNAFERNRRTYFDAVNSVKGPNVIRVCDFFRYGPRYYNVTEKVQGNPFTPEALQKYPFKTRLLLCMSIAHAFDEMHEAGITHADVNWDNVIITETGRGNLAGKITGFERGYLDKDGPLDSEALICDPVYMAPETCLFICGEGSDPDHKIDVFSLGILFHQYLAGSLPSFDENEAGYLFNAVLNGMPVTASDSLPHVTRELIGKMLLADPKKRISMDLVYTALEFEWNMN